MPAKAGIQGRRNVQKDYVPAGLFFLDSRLRGNDGCFSIAKQSLTGEGQGGGKKQIDADVRLFLFFFLAAGLLLLLSGCSLPRIIVVKDPLTPEEHINLGVAYEKQGDLENAVREYEAASRMFPGAYLYLGNAYFQKQDWREAEKAYEKALRKDPQNADAFNNLAWLYYVRKENLDRAEELARRALELNPGKERIYRDTLEKILEAKKSRR